MKTLVWITPWSRVCGIADYSKALWPSVHAAARAAGWQAEIVSLDEYPKPATLVRRLKEIQPTLVHFQHEYGVYGGKNPPFYSFPAMIRLIRERMAGTQIIATAHTVLSSEYRFPTQGRGWERPIRAAANHFFLRRLQRLWGPETWGGLDAVVVHSRYQVPEIQKSGSPDVRVIPHFVPQVGLRGTVSRESSTSAKPKLVLVFGFFTPEKGQDVAVEALAKLPSNYRMILAGGTRRHKDRAYKENCLVRAQDLGVLGRLELPGYIESKKVDDYYRRASLVLAPFRETSGSGSLAQAFARGAPVLASDLLLNREINERQQGAIELFKSGDAVDCAQKIQELLEDEESVDRLKRAAQRYAAENSPQRIAEQHLALYEARS